MRWPSVGFLVFRTKTSLKSDQCGLRRFFALCRTFLGGNMGTFSHHTSENDSHRNRREESNAGSVPQEQPGTPRVLACVLLLPKDVGFVMSVLQRLASNDSDQVSAAAIREITSF